MPIPYISHIPLMEDNQDSHEADGVWFVSACFIVACCSLLISECRSRTRGEGSYPTYWADQSLQI